MKKIIIISVLTLISLNVYPRKNQKEYLQEKKILSENKKFPDKNIQQREKRTFKEILKNIDNKHSKKNKKDINVPWSDNSHKSKRYSKSGSILKAKLSIEHRDIIIKPNNNYIDLYVRKKPHIKSILLTTVTGDFNEEDNPGNEYALRSMKYIKANGNELLLYKGKFLGKRQKLYFLITSHYSKHKIFNKAFHIKIPRYVIYGYKWENFGILRIRKGTKINIRTFGSKYGSYKKGFADNVISIDPELYSGKDFYPPKISVEKIKESNNYVVVYILYTDNNKYFKNFYVEEGNNGLNKINFSKTDRVQDLNGILLYSRFDVITKKTVKFKLYIEKKLVIRNITITASDSSGNMPSKPVKLRIPVKGQKINEVMENTGKRKTNNSFTPPEAREKEKQNPDIKRNDNLPPPVRGEEEN